MTLPPKTIDCDVHPTVTGPQALLPYLEPFWRDSVVERGIEALETNSYPVNAPITARPDWRGPSGRAATRVEDLRSQLLDKFDLDCAICNCLFAVQLLFNEDMAAAFCRALNDLIVKEWLDRDPRLRASIVVPLQNIEHAVAEIERCAADRRFVQVLVLAMTEMPLGRRHYWPVYAAAERLGLPIGIHAGSSYRHPPTSLGWPTWYIEDYLAQSQGFQTQVASLISEGVFVQHPGLKVVLIESGITWVPAFLWRFTKFWRGLRTEVPWLDRTPADIFREHFRLTLQPLDAPEDPAQTARAIEHLRSDDLLMFSSDYPHWQFDGDDVLPAGIPQKLLPKILVENARATYSRLQV